MSDLDIPIQVAVTIAGDELTIDFAGTADAVPGNVNCPLAVTRSACAFALRVLLPADAAANAGTYAPMTVRAPDGCLVNARRPSAVVAGNVETSQRIADTVLLALAQACPGLPAQGQGTMNNLVLGGRGWTYYETLGGGQGASASRSRRQRCPRRHDQHAEHADRGPGAGASAARGALRTRLRQRRSRPPPGGRRHRPRHPGSRTGDACRC